LFEVIAREPVRLEWWVVSGKEQSWEQVVGQLCEVGFSGFAAELGAMVIDRDERCRILGNLIERGHFDDAIKVGFERNAIFTKIVSEGKIESATQMLIDVHFEMFVEWLQAHELVEAVERVKNALIEQGRTVEAKKVARRFASDVGLRQ
jgi:hypothetical protein